MVVERFMQALEQPQFTGFLNLFEDKFTMLDPKYKKMTRSKNNDLLNYISRTSVHIIVLLQSYA